MRSVYLWRRVMLPIDQHRDEIIQAVKQNSVVVVVGETGSGKTTRIPVFLYQAGFAKVGITEPRRIAATSVAQFVADQLGTRLGDVVGYQVRFDNQTNGAGALKFMTVGILLREFQEDPDIRKYSVIMVDEAHERSQDIDFVLGLLKNLLKRRTDLKVVIASATIDEQKFSDFFGGAPVVKVSGTSYPVEVRYEDELVSLRGSVWDTPPIEYMAEVVANKVAEIHVSEGPGDVLVFMSGKDDIAMVIRLLDEKGFPDLVALPVYGGLSLDEQTRIFAPVTGKRKVVVATNIAETSITIEGVVYVVDSGVIKQNNFHPTTGIQSLDLVRHSRAGCDQRRGRAGRTRPGVCFRMYSKEDYWSRSEFTEPEIRRVSIAGLVLALADLGIEQIEFMDPPDPASFQEAYETLTALGAISPGKKGITELGRQMARLPLEPRTARMVIEASKHGCVQQIATIAAFLSVPHIYVRPTEEQYQADSAHAAFKNRDSDLVSFLRVWEQYEASGYSHSWCRGNYLNSRSLLEIKKVRQQLFDVLQECGIQLSETRDMKVVMRSAVAGLVYNLLERVTMHTYTGMFRTAGHDVFIHPGSALFRMPPEWLVATDIVHTTKLFARNCTVVTMELLRTLLPHLFTEETLLVSLSEDGATVKALKKVLFAHPRRGEYARQVGAEEVTLSLAEARKVQDQSIQDAEAKGWCRVTFTRKADFSVHADDGTRASDYGYGLVGASVELNVPYYCEPSMTIGTTKFVRPKFRVFELEDKKEESLANAARRLMKAWLPNNAL